MQLLAAMLSKAGGRRENQDYCAFLERDGRGCYVLADGLGGHRGGALASKTAGEGLLQAFAASPGLSLQHLESYLERAREAMASRAAQESAPLRLKTTLVVLLAGFRSALWAHIGDSRLYFFRQGALRFQTSDHSVPQQLVRSGSISAEQIRTHEDRNRLTAAFDGGDLERVAYAEAPVQLVPGDAFLLCSDGFWEYVLEPEMEADLGGAADPEIWLELMEKRLLARAGREQDNYSALALMSREDVQKEGPSDHAEADEM